MKKLEYNIICEGLVEITNAYVYQGSSVVCALVIDFEYDSTVSVFTIDSELPTISLMTEGFFATEIELPQFKGWNIFSITVSSNSVFCCIVRSNN
jgi:hypothetical protein